MICQKPFTSFHQERSDIPFQSKIGILKFWYELKPSKNKKGRNKKIGRAEIFLAAPALKKGIIFCAARKISALLNLRRLVIQITISIFHLKIPLFFCDQDCFNDCQGIFIICEYCT